LKFPNVKSETLNPKSISMNELYGFVEVLTSTWTDGLASNLIRNFAQMEDQDMKWVIFDGPVDALWIENMNTVLDDNMTLCLANGERVRLKNTMKMIFECEDLAMASPATVSRCGMVYSSNSTCEWKLIARSWLEKRDPVDYPHKVIDVLTNLFELYLDPIIEGVNKRRDQLVEPIKTMVNQQVVSILRFLDAVIGEGSEFPF
jgi:dynein heavy chain, axonemal